MDRRGVGVYGCLGLLLWAGAAPAVVPGARVYWVLGTVALASWLAGTRRWRSLASGRTWLLVGSMAALGAVAEHWNGSAPGGWVAAELGLRMAARALAILLAADTLAARVPVEELVALFEGLGLRGLGFALGVAFNMLPAVRRTASHTWAALRQRGGPWRRPLVAWRRLAVTILALTLARGQEVVDAAEARGFAPGRAQATRPVWRRGDVALWLGLAAWGVVLVLV